MFEQVLIRKCQKEFTITLSVGDMFTDVVYEYPDITAHLTIFNTVITDGVPQIIPYQQ